MSFSSVQLAFIANFPLLTPAAFAPPEPLQPEQPLPIPNLLVRFKEKICRELVGLLQYAKMNGFLPNEGPVSDSPTSILEEDAQLFHEYLIKAYTPYTILKYLVDSMREQLSTWSWLWQRFGDIPTQALPVLEQFDIILNLQPIEPFKFYTDYAPIIRMVFLRECLELNIFDPNGWVSLYEGIQDDGYCTLYPELSLLTLKEGQPRFLLDCWNDDTLSARTFPFVCRALEQKEETNITEYLFSPYLTSIRRMSPILAQKIFNRYLSPSPDIRFDIIRSGLVKTPGLYQQIVKQFLSSSFSPSSLAHLILNRYPLHSSNLGYNYDYAKNRLLNFPEFSHFRYFATQLKQEQIMPLLSALGAERVEKIFRSVSNIVTLAKLLPQEHLKESYQIIGFDHIRTLIKKNGDLIDLLSTFPPEQIADSIQAIGMDHISSLIEDKHNLINLLKIFPVALIGSCIQALGDRVVGLLGKDRGAFESAILALAANFLEVLHSLPEDKKIAFFEAIQPQDFDHLIPYLFSLVHTLKIIPADQKIRLANRISSLIDTQDDLVIILNHFQMDNISIWKPIFTPIIRKLIPTIDVLKSLILSLPPSAEAIKLILIKASYSVLVKSEKDHQDLLALLPIDKKQEVQSLRQELCTQSGHTMRGLMLPDLKVSWDDKLSILKNLENLFKIPPSTLDPDIMIFQNILSFIKPYTRSELGKKKLENIIVYFEEILKEMDNQTPIEHFKQIAMHEKKHETKKPSSLLDGLSIFLARGSSNADFQSQRLIALHIQFALKKLNHILLYEELPSQQVDPRIELASPDQPLIRRLSS
jgi:hypothetical protein